MWRLLFILAIPVVAYGAAIFLQENPCSPSAAYEAVQSEILDRLRSPATAEFEPLSAASVTGDESLCQYVIAAHVDSQNAFGAIIRSEFGASVSYTESSGFQVNVVYVHE